MVFDCYFFGFQMGFIGLNSCHRLYTSVEQDGKMLGCVYVRIPFM